MPRGSAPGERRGGRKKGVPNKLTQALRDEMAASGEMRLRTCSGSCATRRRDEMAVRAASISVSKTAVDRPHRSGRRAARRKEAKGGDRGECGTAKHAPGSEPGKRVPGCIQ